MSTHIVQRGEKHIVFPNGTRMPVCIEIDDGRLHVVINSNTNIDYDLRTWAQISEFIAQCIVEYKMAMEGKK